MKSPKLQINKIKIFLAILIQSLVNELFKTTSKLRKIDPIWIFYLKNMFYNIFKINNLRLVKKIVVSIYKLSDHRTNLKKKSIIRREWEKIISWKDIDQIFKK